MHVCMGLTEQSPTIYYNWQTMGSSKIDEKLQQNSNISGIDPVIFMWVLIN